MGQLLEESIDTIARVIRERRGLMQPPCSAEEVEKLRFESKRVLGVIPPERYLDLLRITDGITEDNFNIWASARKLNIMSEIMETELWVTGFVDENHGLRLSLDDFDRLLIFGNSEAHWFVEDLHTGNYGILPSESRPWEYVARFDTFDELIAYTVKRWILRRTSIPGRS